MRTKDRERYQTVYALEEGSIAAPTAGLHFDEALLASLAAKGIASARVTLHVSALEGALASELATFQFATAGSMQTFYWAQGAAGYALSGSVVRPTMKRRQSSQTRMTMPPTRKSTLPTQASAPSAATR